MVFNVKVSVNGIRGFGSFFCVPLIDGAEKPSTLDSFSLEILILLLYKINGDLEDTYSS